MNIVIYFVLFRSLLPCMLTSFLVNCSNLSTCLLIAEWLRAKLLFDTVTIIGLLLSNIKDRIYLKEQGVYEIPCGNCDCIYWPDKGTSANEAMNTGYSVTRCQYFSPITSCYWHLTPYRFWRYQITGNCTTQTNLHNERSHWNKKKQDPLKKCDNGLCLIQGWSNQCYTNSVTHKQHMELPPKQ